MGSTPMVAVKTLGFTQNLRVHGTGAAGGRGGPAMEALRSGVCYGPLCAYSTQAHLAQTREASSSQHKGGGVRFHFSALVHRGPSTAGGVPSAYPSDEGQCPRVPSARAPFAHQPGCPGGRSAKAGHRRTPPCLPKDKGSLFSGTWDACTRIRVAEQDLGARLQRNR